MVKKKKRDTPKVNRCDIRLSDDELEKLISLSIMKEKSKSDILRDALNNYFTLMINKE